MRESLRGRRCLDDLVSAALFGSASAAPERWPASAWESWTEAVAVWTRATRARPLCGPVDVGAVWAALAALAPDPDAPERLPGLTWPKLAARLGIGERRAKYHVGTVYGFRFTGRGRSRHLVRAPCAACGGSHAVATLRAGWCAGCRD